MEGTYWINTNPTDFVAVHLNGCPHSWPWEQTPVGWYGFYLKRGAAIDAAVLFRRPIRECSTCFNDEEERLDVL